MTKINLSTDCRTKWRGLATAALAAIVGFWVAWAGVANAAGTGAEVEAGKQIFQTQCVACHTVGGGDLVGPDLQGVTAKRPREWLQRWIAVPDQMLAEQDPVAIDLLHQFHDVPMPNMQLSAADVAAVLAYLETSASGTSEPAPAPVASAATVPGDPAMGKELFTGAARFSNRGPPCMACHSVAGIGALGGGQLGPDLTTVVTRLGGVAAVSAFVGGSPTPTMSAIWSRTPLTETERADMVAFLAQAAVTQRPVQSIWQLVLLALSGLAILLAVMAWVWRRRLHDGVRRPMIASQRQARG